MQTKGFAPIVGKDPRVLILGTLPGQASLQKGEYYGQPRNVFWRIMGDLFGADPELPYEERKRRLVEAGIALWDVCAAAHRPGSMDTAIDATSVVANKLEAFLASRPTIALVCFNGAKAELLYRQRISTPTTTVRYETLPSTSPANASISYAEKKRRWSIVGEKP